MQVIKLHSCSSIIIQPFALQSTLNSLGCFVVSSLDCNIHKSNETRFLFSASTSVIVKDDFMMNDSTSQRTFCQFREKYYVKALYLTQLCVAFLNEFL